MLAIGYVSLHGGNVFKVLSFIVFILLIISCSELNIRNIDCSVDEDCPSGSSCINKICRFKDDLIIDCSETCKDDETCKDGECIVNDNNCKLKSDCTEIGFTCHTDTGNCVECLEDKDCSTENKFCDQVSFTCKNREVIQGCNSGSGCSIGEHCENEICVASWKSISLGEKHTCAIKENGELFCWGSNELGQLGIPLNKSSNNVSIPKKVGEYNDWISVSSGKSHTCGIRAEAASKIGALYCWGSNSTSELGTGNSPQVKYIPELVNNQSKWLSVSSGDGYTCGITCKTSECKMRDLLCWGKNEDKQLGNGNSDKENMPKKVTTFNNVLKVVTGVNHTCAIDETEDRNLLYCWGKNENHKLGQNKNAPSPLLVDSSNWDHISASANNTCGIKFRSGKTSGWAYCWGSNEYGQLGRVSYGDSLGYEYDNSVIKEGVEEEEEDIFENIQSGYNYSCGINDSQLYCWGSNSHNQLANEDITDKVNIATLVPLSSGMIPSSISVNKFSEFPHTCSIINKSIYCWGAGSYGQLGDGQIQINSIVSIPKKILEP